MRRVTVIKYLVISFLMMGMLTACNNSGELVPAQETTRRREEKTPAKELVVAENIDAPREELSFGNVLLNRSNFWGGLVFQGLLIADENINNVRRDLCEEYMISQNGMTYTFVLQDDLYWHDGKPLTAEDVVWSIETCLKVKEVNEYLQKGLRGIVGADLFLTGKKNSLTGISVEEDVITIEIGKQDSSFLASLAQLPILPKHCLEKVPMEELGSCDFWKMPVGSGPYKVVENKNNKEALLVVNENYSGKIPKIEKICYKILENPDTDDFTFAMTSDPSVIEKYRNNSEYEVVPTGNLYYRYLYFNLDGRNGEEAKRLQSKTVRQALAIAVDRERIVQGVYGDAAIVIDGGIPDTDSWYAQKEEKMKYNPELARQMLKGADFDFSKPLILTRYLQDELSVQLLEEVAADWRAIGIEVVIEPVGPEETHKLWEEPDWYDVGLKDLAAVDYSDWYYEYASDNQLWSKVHENRTIFDVLIIALRSSKWAYERAMLYGEIQSMEAEEMYKIPLAFVPQYVIYNQQELFIPHMEFPNMEYYFDLNLSEWEMIQE